MSAVEKFEVSVLNIALGGELQLEVEKVGRRWSRGLLNKT